MPANFFTSLTLKSQPRAVSGEGLAPMPGGATVRRRRMARPPGLSLNTPGCLPIRMTGGQPSDVLPDGQGGRGSR